MNCFIPERQLCQVKYSWCLAKLIQSFRFKNKIKEFFFNSLVSLSYTLLACKIYSEKSTDSLMETALCMNLFFSWVFFSMINFLVFHFRQFYYNVFEGDYFELKFWSDLLASRTWNTNISPALGRQIPSPKQPVQRFWVGSLVVSTGRLLLVYLGEQVWYLSQHMGSQQGVILVSGSTCTGLALESTVMDMGLNLHGQT